jgi:hypothetical protein
MKSRYEVNGRGVSEEEYNKEVERLGFNVEFAGFMIS